jgi:AcrR family transcriptional regulator
MTKSTTPRLVKEGLLDDAIDFLRHRDESEFRVPDAASRVGCNVANIYHYFDSREGLINAAYARLFEEIVLSDVDGLRFLAENLDSGSQVIEIVVAAIRDTNTSASRLLNRNIVLRIFGATAGRSDLRELIGEIQATSLYQLTEIVDIAQRRGLFNPNIPSRQLAILMQTIVLSRAFDDVSKDPESDDAWANMSQMLFTAFLP